MKPSEIKIGQRVRVVIEGTVREIIDDQEIIIEDENSRYTFEPGILKPAFVPGEWVIHKLNSRNEKWVVKGTDGDGYVIRRGKKWEKRVTANEIKPVGAK